MSVQSLVVDPDFAKLSPADQQAAIARLDPQFGQLSPTDFGTAVTRLQRTALADPANAPKLQTTPAPMETNALGTGVEALQGAGSTAYSGLKKAGTVGLDLTQGIGEGALDTVHGTGELIRKGGNLVHTGLGDKIVPPVGQASLDKIATADNTTQSIGKVAEGVGEFITGDELLKSASILQKLGNIDKLSDAVKLIEKYPSLARMARTITVASAQGGIKEGSTEGAVHGAEAGAVGGALGELTNAVGSSLGKYANTITKKIQQIPEVKAALQRVADAQERLHGKLYTADQSFGEGVIPEDKLDWLQEMRDGNEEVLQATQDAMGRLSDQAKLMHTKAIDAATASMKTAVIPSVSKLFKAAGKGVLTDLVLHEVQQHLYPGMPSWVPAAAGLYVGGGALLKVPGSAEGLKAQGKLLEKIVPVAEKVTPVVSTAVRAGLSQARDTAKDASSNIKKVVKSIGQGGEAEDK